MKIKINDHRKIYAVQTEFNKVFKNLKIVFWGKPHSNSGEHAEELSNENNSTIGACRIIHNKGEITITPAMKVSELQERFADVYGLGVGIQIKSGKLWEHAAGFDALTLEDLNKKASPSKHFA
jgi:hypothetical protein